MTLACSVTWPVAAVLIACAVSVTCMVVVALLRPTIAHPPVAGAPAGTGAGGRGVVGTPRAVRTPLRSARTATPASKEQA